ncbi:MAG: GTPase ObgE, partial [Holosporales bacterium]|nr:GTPase ObgE [Holosporales bacterium]
HQGVGLGDKFLSHIERCRVLIHLISAENDDLFEQYKTVRNELISYGHELASKTEFLAINKIDILSEDEIKAKTSKLARQTKKPVYPISAVSKRGIDDLLYNVLKVIS